jgi:hypothetical protein
MRNRIHDHINYWIAKKDELERLALDDVTQPHVLCDRVLLLVRRAGVHAHHIQEPLRELAEKLHDYLNERKRFRAA